MNILLIDDDEAILDCMSEYLTCVGCVQRVVTANSGSLAIDRYGNHGPFDAIISDFEMPGMNGVEAYVALRQLHRNLPPLIMFTGNILEARRSISKAGVEILALIEKSQLELLKTTLHYIRNERSLKGL